MGFYILIAVAAFAVFYGIDKGFTKIFRGKVQHATGLSVRLNKRYATVGIVISVLGLAAIFTGIREGKALIIGGVILAVMGICLIVYYMTFGLYYDEDSFILTTFGKKSKTYYFREIKSQQLYNSYGNIIIELHLYDGRSVQLQAAMVGVYPFLDAAFEGWLKQRGKTVADCPFHDPDNSCWFPPLEG